MWTDHTGIHYFVTLDSLAMPFQRFKDFRSILNVDVDNKMNVHNMSQKQLTQTHTEMKRHLRFMCMLETFSISFSSSSLYLMVPNNNPTSHFFHSGYLDQFDCMSSSYYLAVDLCLRAQRDNLLGKLCWFPAKAICNTQFESEEQAEQARDVVTKHVFFFQLHEGNAHMDTNWPLCCMKAVASSQIQ